MKYTVECVLGCTLLYFKKFGFKKKFLNLRIRESERKTHTKLRKIIFMKTSSKIELVLFVMSYCNFLRQFSSWLDFVGNSLYFIKSSLMTVARIPLHLVTSWLFTMVKTNRVVLKGNFSLKQLVWNNCWFACEIIDYKILKLQLINCVFVTKC